jgi:hypothetical protein
MFSWLVVASALLGAPIAAPHSAEPAQHVETKLQGLSPAEGGSLIAKLQQAQAQLKAGRNETFELLAGAPASYPAAEVPPRRAFIQMRFENPWSIERKRATGWQSYELVYFPPGPNSLMWKVTVLVGLAGELERVEMLYTAPPPF